jgi:hypothetical protein
MICDDEVVVGRLVDVTVKGTLVHHIHNELADVIGIRRIEHVHWATQGGGHDSGPPGMSTLTPDNGFGLQHASCIDDAPVDFL